VRSGLNHGVISKDITGTDRRTVRAQTVLRLDASFNTRYPVTYYVFALILALWQARIITNPTIQSSSFKHAEDDCMVGLVIIRARHSAKIRAKSLIRSEKSYFNHCTPMQWNGRFWTEISPSGFIDRFDTQQSKHAVHSYLRTRTTAQTEYLIVVLLMFRWNFEYINSLSLRDTHWFKKQKYEISRTFAVKTEKPSSVEFTPADRLD
jgi:hypothetical protein